MHVGKENKQHIWELVENWHPNIVDSEVKLERCLKCECRRYHEMRVFPDRTENIFLYKAIGTRRFISEEPMCAASVKEETKTAQ